MFDNSERLPAARHESVFQGWLKKRGPTVDFMWEQRWCVLTATSLIIYTNDRCAEKKTDVDILSVTSVVPFKKSHAPGESVKHKGDHPNGFVLDPDPSAGKSRRLFYFDAEDSSSLARWVSIIEERVKKAPSPTPDRAEVAATTFREGELAGDADSAANSQAELGYFDRESLELEQISVPPDVAERYHRRHVFQTGSVYSGQWVGKQRDGFGVQSWRDGASYHGQWVKNMAHGRGQFRHADGDTYIGEWASNAANGCGIYRASSTKFEGQWSEDLQHGYGVESWVDGGAQFAGQFVKGMKSGYGVYRWGDSSQYIGHWNLNVIDGHGTYTATDGRRFGGQWSDSVINGIGSYTWPGGRCYEGQYVGDVKQGYGVFKWADGRIYEGYWVDGKQHGFGRYNQRLGEWESGRCVRNCDEDDEPPLTKMP